MYLDPKDYLVAEARDAVAMVFPSETIKHATLAVGEYMVREHKVMTAQDQMRVAAFREFLVLVERHRPFLDAQRAAEGIVALWEREPRSDSKPTLRVCDPPGPEPTQ